MALRISVYSSAELRAILSAARYIDRDTRAAIRKGTREHGRQVWQQELAQAADSRLEHRVLVQTGRVKASDRNITLTSATVGRKLRGGLLPSRDFGPVEFGADDERVTYSRRSPAGRDHRVTRNTRAQFKSRNPKGNVVYPAASRAIPRLASLWVQTAVRAIHEAFEGGNRA